MATTFSNISEAMVDENVVAAIREAKPSLDAFSLRIERAESIVNNVIRVPLATDPTEGAKTAGTLITAGGGLTGVDVTLDQFRGASFEAVEGSVSSATLPQFWADKIRGAVHVTTKRIIDYAMALITAANYGNGADDKLVVAAADFNQPDMAELWGKGEKKIKAQRKSIFLNTSYATSLFGQSSIAAIFASAGNNFLATGALPPVLGIPAYHYTALPNNSENLGGFVVGQAAIAVALAAPSQLVTSGSGDVVERRLITDPETGITVQYTVVANGGGKLTGEICALYGVAKGQDAIVRLLTA